jgi:hypothetical protein
MRPVMEAARAAARSGVDDADVVGPSSARAAADAVTDLVDGAGGADAGHEPVQIQSHHAAARDAHRVQFEMRGEFRKGLHTG